VASDQQVKTILQEIDMGTHIPAPGVVDARSGNPAQTAQQGTQQLLQLIEMISSMKERKEQTKRAQAGSNIQLALQLAQQGIDPSGMGLDADKLSKDLADATGGALKLKTPKGSRQGAQPGGAQAANQPSAQAGRQAPGGGVVPTTGQPKTDPISQMAARYAEEIKSKGLTEEAQRQEIRSHAELMKRAEDPDESVSYPAMMKLMASGDKKISPAALYTSVQDPARKAEVLKLAQWDVRNSPEYIATKAKTAQELAVNGMLANPKDAMRVATSWYEGNPAPEDVQWLPNLNRTLGILNAAANLMRELPADKSLALAQGLVTTGSLTQFSGGLVTNTQVELGLKEREVTTGEKRATTEAGRARTEAEVAKQEERKVTILESREAREAAEAKTHVFGPEMGAFAGMDMRDYSAFKRAETDMKKEDAAEFDRILQYMTTIVTHAQGTTHADSDMVKYAKQWITEHVKEREDAQRINNFLDNKMQGAQSATPTGAPKQEKKKMSDEEAVRQGAGSQRP
jgi:hypothetical protein